MGTCYKADVCVCHEQQGPFKPLQSSSGFFFFLQNWGMRYGSHPFKVFSSLLTFSACIHCNSPDFANFFFLLDISFLIKNDILIKRKHM